RPFFQQQLKPADHDLIPARVTGEQRSGYRIAGAAGEWRAEPTGRLRHAVEQLSAEHPCVGDWVMAQAPQDRDGVALVHRILERRTKFSRQAAGERTAEQVVAANIDTVFLVQSLNRDLNLRRL